MGETCVFCSTELPAGASICRGCGAELIYGASPRETTKGAKWGAFGGFFLYLIMLSNFRSMSFTLYHVLFMLFLGAVAGAAVVGALNRHLVRFFRASRNF